MGLFPAPPFGAELLSGRMTDKRDNDKGRPRKPGAKSGRSFRKDGPPTGSGPRKPRAEGAGRSFKPREEGARTFKPREDRGERSFKPRGEGTRTFKPREERGERSFKPREEGARTFKPREDRGERSFKPREEGARTFKPREDRGERSFKPREDGERNFRARAGDGNRPIRRRLPPKVQPTVRTVERSEGEERIAKVMARVGLCSRRDAEAWIAQGRVAVNGVVIDSPALNVGPQDKVTVDGAALGQRERTRLWLFYKPRGYVTTAYDPEGRPTIFDILPADLPRVVTIGRLDINTEGLLLLTNDGGLARVLELPTTAWLRRYRVRAHGETNQAQLDSLRNGVTVEGIEYQGIEATLDRVQGANSWLTLGLREGKNREVKRVLESLGLDVNRLIRISFGPFQLAELAEGGVEEIKTRILKDQLGETLAREANADFDAPVFERDRDEETYRRPQREERRPSDEGEDDKPRTKPLPGARKHISTLREQKRDGDKSGPRKRIERQATSDRRGRAVKVERVVAAGKTSEPGGTRNARRFATERNPRSEGESRERSFTPREDRAPRTSRDDRAPRSRDDRGGERTFRKPREEGDRPARSRDDRAPRTHRDDRAPRSGTGDFAGGERPARKPREPGAFGNRDSFKGKPRSAGPRSEGPRSEGPRGPRREGGRPQSGRPFGDRPSGGDRPKGGRPFGGGKRPDGPRGPRRDR